MKNRWYDFIIGFIHVFDMLLFGDREIRETDRDREMGPSQIYLLYIQLSPKLFIPFHIFYDFAKILRPLTYIFIIQDDHFKWVEMDIITHSFHGFQSLFLIIAKLYRWGNVQNYSYLRKYSMALP